jgi:hypothetical protein
MTQNGFLYELTANNADVKYHQLWSNIKGSSQKLIKFDREADSFVRNEMILSLFEFKVFAYSFFLNKLRVDDPDKFKLFARTCLSQLVSEQEELVLRAEESMLFHIPGHFHRDQEYLVEKFQYYMQDIENFTKKGIYPKYSIVSILEMPFDHPQEIFYRLQQTTESSEFVAEYIDILNALKHRYEFTPGVKTQEEIEREKQKFSSIPSGSHDMDRNGIDGYNFGMSTEDIEKILGNPDENPKYSGTIDEYLEYKKLGISFGFKNNSLVVINIYSGRPEGWGETNYQKYSFRNNNPFTMDSFYTDILKLYGAPEEEKEFPKAKIHCKSLVYGRFSFSFYTSNDQLYYFQYKSKDFK